MSKSLMTIRVYQLTADGQERELSRDRVCLAEPYRGQRSQESTPCECPYCIAKLGCESPGATA